MVLNYSCISLHEDFSLACEVCPYLSEWAVNAGRQFKVARQGISGSLHEAALFTLGQESPPVFPQGCLETGQTQTGF